MQDNENIDRLLNKLNQLMQRQDLFQKEIADLRTELNALKNKNAEAPVLPTVNEIIVQPLEPVKPEIVETPVIIPVLKAPVAEQKIIVPPTPPQPKKKEEPKFHLEDFIGRNVISKIGIVIVVIGISIGTKYAIDNNLLSPLTRIILGYVAGLALLLPAIRLKKKYETFSAILLSGSMAAMYFVTYAAFYFYQLMPQALAFAIMVCFTIFTVTAALHYNMQVIAHIGLVGAYAVPFMLSDSSGRALVLFTYMAIINTGILIIAFKKYWKLLYYVAFGLTWLIFASWFGLRYKMESHFMLSLVFSSIFFIIFYLTALSYKLIKKEKFDFLDILMVMLNSFIFFGYGYATISTHKYGSEFLGLFTLANAIIHFIISAAIYRIKLVDRNLFYLTSALVLSFLTIAIPVQLDGSWVTLLWATEAALLFMLGRIRQVSIYQNLSYILMMLAFMSICHDLGTKYDSYIPEKPETRIAVLLNINCMTSVLVTALFIFIGLLNRKAKYLTAVTQTSVSKFMDYLIPVLLFVIAYISILAETANYWNQALKDSGVVINVSVGNFSYTQYDYNLSTFKAMWLFNFSFLYFAALSFINYKFLKNGALKYTLLTINSILITIIIPVGLVLAHVLKDAYYSDFLNEYYTHGFIYVTIRYIFFAFAVVLFVANHFVLKECQRIFRILYTYIFHSLVLSVLTSELICLLEISGRFGNSKIAVSILWGLYAFTLIAWGIWKKKKHIRFTAIGFFAVTLFKLFLYDIMAFSTLAKTIAFIALGALLLTISFLYTKYKHVIFMKDETDKG